MSTENEPPDERPLPTVGAAAAKPDANDMLPEALPVDEFEAESADLGAGAEVPAWGAAFTFGTPAIPAQTPMSPVDSSVEPAAQEQPPLDDLADDMRRMTRRMRAVEQTLEQVAARLEELPQRWEASLRNVAREMDVMRRDLFGERKHTAATQLFNEIIPLLERLRIMKASLTEPADTRLHEQLDSLIQTLAASLRRLACVEFTVEAGEPFDPARMECLAFAEGVPGMVVSCARPGYLAGQAIVRPAGVIMAKPVESGASGASNG